MRQFPIFILVIKTPRAREVMNSKQIDLTKKSKQLEDQVEMLKEVLIFYATHSNWHENSTTAGTIHESDIDINDRPYFAGGERARKVLAKVSQ